jgi:hypothetical protein
MLLKKFAPPEQQPYSFRYHFIAYITRRRPADTLTSWFLERHKNALSPMLAAPPLNNTHRESDRIERVSKAAE